MFGWFSVIGRFVTCKENLIYDVMRSILCIEDHNKTGIVKLKIAVGMARKPLLPWKSNKYYIFFSVCVRVRACVSVLGCVSVCMRLRGCSTFMRHIVMSFWSLSAPCFSTLSQKRNDFRKKGIDNKMCVLVFSTVLCKIFFYFRNNLAKYYHKCENGFS